MPTNYDVISVARSQIGKPYVWGAKPTGPNPVAFDCSGYLAWIADQLGLPPLGGGTWGIKAVCRAAGTMMPVRDALALPGSIVGMDYPTEQHVAIPLGGNQTVEARGRAYGTGVFPGADGRPWNWAARWPGVTYPPPHGETPSPSPQEVFHAMKLNQPAIAIVPTVTERGYWIVAADGGVFAFGDARPMDDPIPAMHLNAPIVNACRLGDGLALVAADGGVMNVGGSSYFGSVPELPAPQ